MCLCVRAPGGVTTISAVHPGLTITREKQVGGKDARNKTTPRTPKFNRVACSRISFQHDRLVAVTCRPAEGGSRVRSCSMPSTVHGQHAFASSRRPDVHTDFDRKPAVAAVCERCSRISTLVVRVRHDVGDCCLLDANQVDRLPNPVGERVYLTFLKRVGVPKGMCRVIVW